MKIRSDIFGWFERGDEIPKNDPPLNAPCIFCMKPCSVPMKTISLMKPGDDKSYFYRCHKACYEERTPEDICRYESSLIDNIE